MFARQCTCCDKPMNEGYLIAGGDAYYCSEECLQKKNTAEEIAELKIGEDDSESYWTDWEDKTDLRFKVTHGKVEELAENSEYIEEVNAVDLAASLAENALEDEWEAEHSGDMYEYNDEGEKKYNESAREIFDRYYKYYTKIIIEHAV